jgi:UDP-N-acetylglucosamine--N-acetylmuramyl-(pentapeptide) pyrophosphoryl-undecaprenol N-acetylglucosamine transferase
MNLVITGGHHTSALPVIKKLQKDRPDIQIFWFGHKYSMQGDKNSTLEYKEITSLNIPFYDLKAGKLYKTYNLLRLLKIPFGVLQAVVLLLMVRPKLIMSFGGYLAAPTVIAGRLLGIPSITHEQTVIAGYANKLISRFADKILVSWPPSAAHFPKNKVIVTGIPVRPEIFTSVSDNFTVQESLPTIYITAGKTGSNKINLAVEGALEKLLQKCNVIHQCGDNSVYKDFSRLSVLAEKFESQGQAKGRYFVRKFILDDEIGEAFTKSNLVVCRAGAHTVAELIALEKPAILIPIPWVSHNEQLENAKIVKDAGLGIILEEKHLSPESLNNMVGHCLDHLSDMVLRKPSTSTSEGSQVIEVKSLIKDNSVQLIIDEITSYFM